MGRVFLAERSDGHYQQQVAIKLLLGWSGTEALARLTSERQILARMNHPHIAKRLDGGTTRAGQPYLVMEYADGDTIDAWCDRQQATLAGWVALAVMGGVSARLAWQLEQAQASEAIARRAAAKVVGVAATGR